MLEFLRILGLGDSFCGSRLGSARRPFFTPDADACPATARAGMKREGDMIVHAILRYAGCFVAVCAVSFLLVVAFAFCARKKKAMVWTGVALFAIGFSIYFTPDADTAASKALEAANSTLSAFYPSRGSYDNVCDNRAVPSIAYWMFHLAAILYILVLAVSFFCIEFINSILLRCCKSLRCIRMVRASMNVFWNYGAEAETLAKNLGSKDVVFVLPQNVRSWRDLQSDERACSLVRKGFLWVTDSGSAARKLAFARKHFFVGGDAHENVEKAQRLLEHLEENPPSKDVRLYVRVWPEADDDAVFDWADGWNRKFAEKSGDCDIEVAMVREENIVSRKFLIEHPMLDCPGVSIDPETAAVSGAFKILVVGFGFQGERLMGDMVCDAQFLDATGKAAPVSVDVVDKDASSFGWFKANCREACERYSMNFANLDAGDESFWEWLGTRGRYNRIVVCTQSDIVNLGLANDLANYYAQHFKVSPCELRNTLFARVRRSSLAATLAEYQQRFQTFGSTEKTYSRQWLVDDKWDKGAMFINGVWAAKYDKRLPPGARALNWYVDNNKNNELGDEYWRKASASNKESSRASFLHIRNLLRLLGFEMFSAAEKAGGGEYREIHGTPIEKVKKRLENTKRFAVLAESEHMRWEAFYFVRGWKRWHPAVAELEILANGAKGGIEPNAMKKYKLHGNLVSYGELDALDELFNSVNRAHGLNTVNSKEKDDAIVWGLEAVYDAGGFFIGKKESVNG